MSQAKQARTPSDRSSWIVGAALLLVIAAFNAAAGGQLLATSSATAASPTSSATAARPTGSSPPAPPIGGGRTAPRRGLGEADGAIPAGTTIFDDGVPGVANLDPALLGALRSAAEDAAQEGIEFRVNSGWRSPAYQEELLREAVAKYGSDEQAARWVGSPTTSAHVSGDAVDLAPAEATTWLSRHGPEYGLCQIYRNEPWHYELRPAAVDQGCPAMYADPTHDPRMH